MFIMSWGNLGLALASSLNEIEAFDLRNWFSSSSIKAARHFFSRGGAPGNT
jgi:hypothetical protein